VVGEASSSGQARPEVPAGAAGLFGKLPAHGDFVRRGLPGSFCEPWDAWLQRGMDTSRAALGDDAWAALWDAAPAWRFLLPAGACGPDAVAGVMLPSRDSVGRRFPLTLAALRPPDHPPGGWPAAGWFAMMEGAARAGRDQGLDADGLATLLPAPGAASTASEESDGVPEPGWWTADTADGPGLVWPLPALPDPEEFVLLLEPPS
jgi:type VI secretion system protein ImpM